MNAKAENGAIKRAVMGGQIMDLLQLQYFCEAAKREHITRAAEALHITQPTLSKVISRLEGELDCPLFSRSGKHVHLTPYGKVLLHHTEKVFDQLQQLQAELTDLKEGCSGSIRIGSCFPPRDPPQIWKMTSEFMREQPNIGIGILQLPPENLRQSLYSHEIDIALTTMPIVGKGIQWIHLYDEPMGVIIAKDHPLAQKEVLSLSELSEFSFICNDMNSDEGNLTRTFCQMAGFEPAIVYAASITTLIRHAVSAGTSVSFITPSVVSDQEASEDNIAFRPLSESYCIRQYGIAILSNVYHTNALRRYLQTILSAFGITELPF